MPKKRTFIWISAAILLIGALCLVVWLFPEQDADESLSAPDEQILFDSNEPDSITSLSFTFGERSPLSFVFAEGGWQAEGYVSLAISDTAILNLLDKLSFMLAERTVTENSEYLSEYGLDKPSCQIALTSDEGEKRYLFGHYSEYYDGYYCMIDGQTTVYMVDKSFVDSFDLTMEDLLGSDHLPDLNGIQSVVWQVSGQPTVTALPDGEHHELLTLLSSLELGKWIDFGRERFPIFGLDSPAVAELTLWDGAMLKLSFGMGESDEFIYLRVGESELIYLAECSDLALLCEYIGKNQ